jgi:EF-hand domain
MKHSLVFVAFLLGSMGTANVNAQESSANPMMAQGQPYGGGMMGYGMGDMMSHGMGMGGPGMMMRPGMIRMMVVMMDTDGDGALSLEEVQSVHARIFKAMDADKNGKVTLEEIQQFFRGQ